MNHKRRGKAIIFNHGNFPRLKVNSRDGTNYDRDKLKIILTQLDFDVKVHNDLRWKEIEDILERTRKEDHSDADCIFVAVMTHGHLGKLCASDKAYDRNLIWSGFTADKCKSLVGKPKLFFIQVSGEGGRRGWNGKGERGSLWWPQERPGNRAEWGGLNLLSGTTAGKSSGACSGDSST